MFARAVEALYPFAYTLKFASKTELGQDYVVPPLEGLWWAEDLSVFTTRRDKSLWSWTLLLLVPAWVPDDLVVAAREKVRAKGAPERLDDVRLESLEEGLCVQTLHVGSFDDEGPVLERIHSSTCPPRGCARRASIMNLPERLPARRACAAAHDPAPARDALSQASGPTATSRTTTLPRTARTPHTRPVKPPATSEDK